MPQRTLGEARRRLEDLTPVLNDFHKREAEQALTAAENKAKTHVDGLVRSELERLTNK
jgi:hypothetical protein